MLSLNLRSNKMRLLLLRLRNFEERVIKRQRERDLEMSLTLDGLITKQQKTNFIQMNPHRSNKRKNPIVHREFQRHILNQECKVMTMSSPTEHDVGNTLRFPSESQLYRVSSFDTFFDLDWALPLVLWSP